MSLFLNPGWTQAGRAPWNVPFRRVLGLALPVLVALAAVTSLRAAPVYLYHERSFNSVTGGTPDTTCAGVLPFVDILAPFATQAVTIRFQIELNGLSDNARVYYTTDGSDPEGSLGAPFGSTLVASASYECIFTNGGNAIDVVVATIPAQPAPTTVRYIVSAWDSATDGLEIFGVGGTATSPFEATVFSYTVASAPGIIEQPASATNHVGATASFTVAATGSEPLAYQWFKDGTNLLADATGATLVLVNVTTNDTGGYSAVITNDFGSVTSVVATLTVLQTPAVTQQPSSLTLIQGNTATFNTAVAGETPLSLQWHFGESPLAGATNASLVIPNVQLSNAGPYTLVATNSFGAATSAVATLTVLAPPNITAHPVNLTNVYGTTATFMAAAAGSQPLALQWYFNRTNAISGGTNRTLVLSNVTLAQMGDYRFVAANFLGRATSAVATLTVTIPLEITQQPASLTVTQGSSATFSVVAAGDPPISFQWRRNGANLADATNTALTIPGAQPADAGNYDVVLTNPTLSLTSVVATVTVLVPAQITAQPQSLIVTQNNAATFSVTAAGTAPLSHQWRFEGEDLLNETNSTLNFASAQPNQAGDYSVVVANVAGLATSAVATLTVLIPPSITAHPQSLVITQGHTATFTVNATGTAPLNYQWFFNDTNVLAGETNSTLVLLNAPQSASGNYRLVVSNIAGVATSSLAMLTVVIRPFITQSPASLIVTQGHVAMFTVTAGGDAPLSYQWRHDGAAIASATSASFSLAGAQSSDAGSYDVVITNLSGSLTSSTATLTVLVPPSISAQPQSLTVPQGQPATFDVTATGSAPLAYQWRHNGSPIAAATNSSLTLSNAQLADIGDYSVVVANVAGNVTSADAMLFVLAAPAITQQPMKRTVFAGENHTFTVAATGNLPLAFQWRRAGVNLTGQTNDFLALTNIQPADAALYSVVVTNIAGSVTSAPASLTVRAASDPRYPAPQGGWAYLLAGNAASNSFTNALDGAWNRLNGLDSWDNLGRGAGNGLLGGVDAANGLLTLEDAIPAGGSAGDNRRFYFTHDLGLEAARVTNANFVLNEGVTLTFRGRLTPATEPLVEITNAPNGWVNANDGKGVFGLRQSSANSQAEGMIISFSLHNAVEDTATNSSFNFSQAGLHMNNLGANSRSSFVDPGEPGTLNVLPLNPAEFHEFWITIRENGADPGTHAVTVYLDGSRTGTVFNVTAGIGRDDPFTNYLALGLGVTPQRGAVDVDFLGYAPGVLAPTAFNEPVGFTSQPANVTLSLGEFTTFNVGVTGTPPYSFQWFRNGAAIAGATNASYTTPSMTAPDDGAQFTVVVTNDCNSITSAPPAGLFLLRPPTITAQPQSQSATNGDAVTLTVAADSVAPPSYQWRFNGFDLSGEISSTLTLSAVAPASAGNYDVIVSNAGGAITSAVAVLAIRVLDLGDAPSPYPVLRANDGAAHVLTPGIQLGAAIDFELDGLPAPATSDDFDGADDEDGVQFISPLRAAQPAFVEVIASTNGLLDAWIDFNADGSWAQAGEQIFTNRALVAGTNTLVFIVSPGAVAGGTFARFRFSTAGGLSFTGPAADGEVEDHALTLEPAASLVVRISDAPDPVGVGSNLTYSITVSNAGPSGATAIALTNLLPAGVSFVSMSASQGNCNHSGGQVNCALNALANGGAAVVTVIVSPVATATLTNHAFASAAEFEPNPADNTAIELTTVLGPPLITAQPQPLTVTNGSSATFTVTAIGAEPLRYQWRLDGVNLAGETNASFIIPNALPANAGAYTVRVANEVGAVLSDPASLTVLVPPTVTAQPQSRTNLAGGTATFSVIATGTAPLLYQWYFNGATPVTGQTNAILIVGNAQPSQAGAYHVVVSNSAGLAASDAAQLTLIEMDFADAPDPSHPTLLSSDGARHRLVPGIRLGALADFEPEGQPDSSATGDDVSISNDEDGVTFLDPVLVGQIVRVAVIASTNGQLDAWLDFSGNSGWADAGEQIFTNVPLATGANTLQFTVPFDAVPGTSFARFRFSTAGGLSFTGEAMDGEVEDYAFLISAAVELSAIKQGPATPVTVGSNVTFVVNVTNTGPSTASAVTFTDTLPGGLAFVSAVSSQGNCAQETGVVTCALGVLASNAQASISIEATVMGDGALTNLASVSAPETDLNPANNTASFVLNAFAFPAIITPPPGVTVTNGDPVVLSVIASGTALQFQWRRDGLDLPGATNATLTFASVATNDAGSYSVRVANQVGAVTSSSATLTVLVPATVLTPPMNLSVVAGQDAAFTVIALGTEPLSYQWQHEGTDLPGATNATLLVTNCQPARAGLYRVLVANMVRAVLSDAARLTVFVPPTITLEPQGRTNFAGSDAAFSVSAIGTEPLSYQWWFEGATPLPGQTNATLLLTNVQTAEAGGYTLVITNLGGAITSAIAILSVIEADFADAPEAPGYPTRLIFNGPWHRLVPGVRLGAAADFEPDGQPDATAMGDNIAGANDEDGVVFLTPLLLGQTSLVQVTVTTNGLLDAWIDFNASGNWIEAGEQIFASQAVTAGVNGLTFTVPPTASLTNTFARFRFSTAGGLSFEGPADDGEVEDHAISVTPAFDLALTFADAPDPSPATSNVVFTMTVTNIGPSPAPAVWLTNLLPVRGVFVSAVSSQGACSNDSGRVLCDLGALTPGGSATVAVTAIFDRAGTVTTFARVAAPGIDVNPANDSATQTTAIVTPAAAFVNDTTLSVGDATTEAPGVAAPYPSTLSVSGLTGIVHRVTVTLRNASHTFPGDLDLLLVGPRGQACLLMSDAGGGLALADVTFTLDDVAEVALPSSGLIFNQAYRPTDFGMEPDVFPAPAPSGPYPGALSVFAGTDPNGVWSLYVVDDTPNDTGLLAGGWGLDITTVDPLADLAVSLSAAPNPTGVSSNVTYIIAITNLGPAAAGSMKLTNTLAAGVEFISATLPGGTCVHDAGVVACQVTSLAPSSSATATIVVRTPVAGFLSNHVVVASGDLDFVPANNTAHVLTTVLPANDLVLTAVASTNRVVLGQSITYTMTVTNHGPAPAAHVVLTDRLPAGANVISAVSSIGGCTNVGGTVVCDFGALSTGAGATVEIALEPSLIGLATNSVAVVSDEVEFSALDNRAGFITPVNVPADLALSIVTVPNPVAATSNQTHIITVTNHGPAAANGVLVTAMLPPPVTFLRLASTHGACTNDTGTVRCAIGALAAGEAAVIQVQLTTTTTGPLLHTAVVTSDSFDFASADNAATAVVAVLAPPVIVTQPISRSVFAGATVTFSVAASGEPPLRYQWQKNGADVPGETNASLVLSSVNAASQGSYRARVENIVGATVTVAAQLVLLLPPTVSDVPDAGTDEDMPITVAFTVGDTETPPAALILTASSSDTNLFPASGLSLGGSGAARTLTLQPATNSSGFATITLTVTDTDGATASDSFLVTVAPVNDPPTLAPIADQEVPQDTGPHVVLLGGIGTGAEDEAQTLTLTAVSDDPGLIPHPIINYTPGNTTASLAFLPTPGITGIVSVIITVNDGAPTNNTASRTFLVNVAAVDYPPQISAIAAMETPEDTAVGVPFSVHDAGTPPDQLSVTVTSSDTNLLPPSGLVLTGTGAVRLLQITPAANLSGAATLTLTVTDTNNLSVSRGFSLTVLPVNDPPTLGGLADIALKEDTASPALPFTLGDLETAVGALTVTAHSSNTNLVPNGAIAFGGFESNRTIAFTPATNRSGSAIITVTVTDEGGAMISGQVHVTVTPVNDVPTLASISNVTVNESSVAQTVVLTGIGSGAEDEAQVLLLAAVSDNPALIPTPASVYTHPQSTGLLTFAPVHGAHGPAVITVTVNDQQATNNITTQSFTVTVTPVDDPPGLGFLPPQSTAEDTPLAVPFIVTDDLTPAAALAVTASASDTNLFPTANIVLSGSGSNRTITLLPATNLSGSAMITLTVTDTNNLSSTRAFVLNVEPVNDPPQISDLPNQFAGEDTNGLTVAFTVGDVETAAASLIVTARSSNPSLVPDASLTLGGSGTNRTLSFALLADATGTTIITLSVRDAGGLAATDTFTLTIVAANDPPFISSAPDSAMNQDSALGLAIAVGDVETAANGLVLTALSSNTNLVAPAGLVLGGSGPNRTLTITPQAGATGSVTITLIVTDEGAATASDVFTLTVLPVAPMPPSITGQPQSQSVAAGGSATFAVTATSSAPLAYQWRFNGTNLNSATNATLLLSNVQAPNAGNYFVVVSNVAGAVTSAVATLTVVTPGLPPAISGLTTPAAVNEDTVLVRAFTITDPDTPVFRLVLSATSTNSALISPTNVFFDGNGTNRLLILRPSTNAFGTSLISVFVNDGSAMRTNSFLLTVNPVNDPPTLNSLNDVLADGSGNPPTQTITLAGISSGASNETQTLAITATSGNTALVPNPSVSYASPSATGTISFDAGNNSSGSAVISVAVSDGAASNNVVSQSFTAYYFRGNLPPTITALGNQTINEDTSTAALPFTVGDSATPVASLTLRGFSSNPSLLPTNNIVFGGSGANRTVTLNPLPNQSGTSSVRVAVFDTGTAFAVTTFTLTVNPSNDLPSIAGVTTLSVPENSATAALPFRVSDLETPADRLVVTAGSSDLTLVPLANIVLGGNGTNRAVMITPASNRAGSATITLTATDANGGAASTNFVLTVTGTNHPPVISAFGDVSFNEDSPGAPIAFTVGDDLTLPGSLTLSAASTNAGLLPAVNIAFGGTGANRTVTLTPVANQSGRTRVTLTVTDGGGMSASTSFMATFLPVNDAPTLDSLADVAFSLGGAPRVVSLSGIASGAANENQFLVVTAVSANPAVVPHPLVGYSSPGASGTLTLAPIAAGSTTITVTVNDGGPNNPIVSRSFNVTVTGPPTLGVLADQVTNEDTPTAPIALTVGDTETAAGSLAVTASSSDTTLLPASTLVLGGAGANRTLTLTPATNQFGHCTVTVSVTDADTNTTTRSFGLIVRPVNDPPTLNAIAGLNFPEDATEQLVNLSGITPGAANESQSLSITATSSHPDLVPHPSVNYTSPAAGGSLAFTPMPDATGTATVTVVVFDGHSVNGSVTQAFTVTVTATNDLPTLSNIPDQTTREDTPLLVGFFVGDLETSADALTLSVTSSDTNLLPLASIIPGGAGPNRALSIQPAFNQSGSATITVTVADNEGGSASDSFVLHVGAENDPPSITSPADAVTAEDTPTPALSFTVGDAETGAASLTVRFTSSNLSLLPTNGIVLGGIASNRTVTITPATNAFGTALITLTVADGGGAAAETSFTLTVNAVEDVPALSNLADVMTGENTPTSPITFAIGDAETPAANLNVSATSSDPALVPVSNIVFGGSGSNRTVTLTPTRNRFGSAVITLIVTDGAGMSASDTFGLTVVESTDAPVIFGGPADVTVAPWSEVSISVVALGSAPLAYQWQRNGVDLPNATNATLVIPHVLHSDAGSYRVRVSNGAGSATSAAAILQVTGAPVMTSITRTGAAAFVSFTTASGPNYTVEYRDEAPSGAWSILPAISGTGGIVTVSDPDATTPRRYYRVRED